MKISNYVGLLSLLTLGLSVQAKVQDYSGRGHAAVAKVLSRSKSTILELQIDLHECYDQRIRDTTEIERFLNTLCTRLKITDPGDSRLIVCDGSLMSGSVGCIFIQIADDVYIIGRIINETNSVQLTISSSINYNTNETADFAKRFFGASSMDFKVSVRK